MLVRYIIPIVWLIGSLDSCKTTTPNQSKAYPTKEQGNILFVTVRIINSSDAKESIELVNKIWSSGTLKNPGTATQELADNMLICEFLDSKKKLIKSVTVENPLYANLEHFSADGRPERVQTELLEAYFTIRTEIDANVAYLLIKGNKNQKLGLIKLL